jgi:hypothetical protein
MMKKTILSIAMLTSIIFTSCSSDDDSNNTCGSVSSDETVQIFENFISAGITFGVNPTSESCSNYKNAANAYADYSESIKNCLSGADKTELEEEIIQIRAELASLDCE